MRGLYLILAGLLVLVVAIAGCVGKQAPKEPAAQPPAAPPAEPPPAQPQAQQPPAVEGDIAVPEEGGLQIEQAQSSADEDVDLGSLI